MGKSTQPVVNSEFPYDLFLNMKGKDYRYYYRQRDMSFRQEQGMR